jgi:hypothetical protein
MSATGPNLVLLAGTATFGNEWLQTGNVNWQIPIATLLGALALSVIDKISAGASTGLGAMVLIGALATPINGKSPIQEIQSNFPNSPEKKGK